MPKTDRDGQARGAPDAPVELSVLIPHFGPQPPANRCLESLLGRLPPGTEVLVVSDRSGPTPAEGPVRHVAIPPTRGAAEARNLGALSARGRWLVFLDADVSVTPDFFDRLASALRVLPDNALVQGIYSEEVPCPTLASEYKNLYYRYNFTRRSPGPSLVTLSSHCFGLRRADFVALRGFDAGIPGATVEDSDFGLRALSRGYRIVLDPNLEVAHHKRFTLGSLLRTDFGLCRSKVKMILRRRNLLADHPSLLSVSGCRLREMLPVVLSVLLTPAVWAGALQSSAAAPLAIAAILALNAPFYSFIWSRRGPRRAFGCALVSLLDFQAAFFGACWGALEFLRSRRY